MFGRSDFKIDDTGVPSTIRINNNNNNISSRDKDEASKVRM